MKIHGAIASSAFISKLYLCTLGVLLKGLPESRLKLHIINNLYSVEWPEIQLPAQKVRIQKSEFKIIPHLGEFDFEAMFVREMRYEKNVTSFLTKASKRYDAILEIGANVGIYTLFFSTFYPEARIYAFEPSRKAYSRLLKNIELNPSENKAHLFNAAIGDSTGFQSFYEPQGHLTNGSLRKDFAAIFSNDVVANQVLMIEGALLIGLFEGQRSVLVKIDAEGSEGCILKSLMPFLRAVKPDLLVECLGLYRDELNQLNLTDIYSIYQLTKDGAVPRAFFEREGDRDYVLLNKGESQASH